MVGLSSNLDELRRKRNRSSDRIFVLSPIEGKFSLNGAGVVDKRLYAGKGENNLHAKQLPNGLWSLYLDHGLLPQPLKQLFTNFHTCEKFVREYYLKRNIEVKEIID